MYIPAFIHMHVQYACIAQYVSIIIITCSVCMFMYGTYICNNYKIWLFKEDIYLMSHSVRKL